MRILLITDTKRLPKMLRQPFLKEFFVEKYLNSWVRYQTRMNGYSSPCEEHSVFL